MAVRISRVLTHVRDACARRKPCIDSDPHPTRTANHGALISAILTSQQQQYVNINFFI